MGRDGREEEHKVGDGLVLAEEMGGRRVWLSSTYLTSLCLTCHIKWAKKEMAIHSSTLAWKIPWMGEPGRLECMGSQRVEHN